MKKFVSIILALTMVLALGLSAYADFSDTDARTQSTTVSINLGAPCATWSIPASLSLTESNSYTDYGTVKFLSWKAEAGERWSIACASSLSFVDTSISAIVTYSELTVDSTGGVDSTDVTVSASNDSLHLAGEDSANLEFTLSYSGDAA